MIRPFPYLDYTTGAAGSSSTVHVTQPGCKGLEAIKPPQVPSSQFLKVYVLCAQQQTCCHVFASQGSFMHTDHSHQMSAVNIRLIDRIVSAAQLGHGLFAADAGALIYIHFNRAC